MINKLDVLIKSITLLIRENILKELSNNDNIDNSKDLIKNILSTFKNDKKVLQGGDSLVAVDLEGLVTDMVNNPDKYTKDVLLQTLSVLLKDKDNIYNIIEKAINADMEASGLKISIISLRKFLNLYYREVEMANLISKASFLINTNRLEVPFQEYIASLITNLEGLNNSVKGKDPGLMGELDFSNENEIEKTVEEVRELAENKGKFLTGWKEVNRMINGAMRKGEMWCISALQHNYKSGFIQSLFVQFCTLNRPVLNDPNKKPLIVLFSFEDDINIIIEFIYRYMYYNEYGKLPDLSNITTKEIGCYIKNKLSINGFHSKIIRANPTEWTYKNMFNKVLEWESEGYEVQAILIDYLSKLPTTYCDRSGPSGTDVRDLFTRVRDFCSARNALVITNHQISTEALSLWRSGIQGFDFIDEITSKNYYSESKQIPQVLDGEIYISKGKYNGQWALFIGKGKHRSPIITPDEDKRCVLMFPKRAPIPENINDVEDVDNNQDFDFK